MLVLALVPTTITGMAFPAVTLIAMAVRAASNPTIEYTAVANWLFGFEIIVGIVAVLFVRRVRLIDLFLIVQS